ncbi:hypothetical protein G7Z17_g11090 [Cylindrodendrum hubeiense]|uniref:WSC domain-containing protein n=1 Tax=Cylindrodendrum hubeiense TaxID=595255 RepID=A0A9P5L487_9HYPO|nr:hypothetical protein G7Z17_g11090 [Cylindrodendrum hubeiense]
MGVLRSAALGAAFLHLTSASVIVRRDLTPPTTPQDGWGYIGCFVDSVAQRSLDGAVHYDTTDLTAETCVAYCADAGFAYAGMEYSAECWCGQTVPTTLVDDSDCSMACSGDATQPCGASDRLTVFTDDLTAPLVADWSYSGCYQDSSASRVLNGDYYADAEDMTHETCISFCEAGDFKYAGVEYSAECFCGNTLPPNKEPETDCDMPCPGDTTKDCGAGNRLSVFVSTASTSPVEPPTIPGWTYIGCIEEGTGGRALTHQVNVAGGANAMTNELCVAACEADGYDLAGTEYAGECFCGNEYANDGGLPGEGCTMKCHGDSSQFCGGSNRLSAWTLGEAPDPSDTSSSVPSATTAVSSDVASTLTTAITSSVASTLTTEISSSASSVSAEGTSTSSAGETESSETAVSTTSSALPSVSGLPTGWAYKGCYIDPAGRAMDGAPGSPSSSNTPEKCIATCIANGFTVAGMEYSEECYCGNALNNGASKTSESDCNMPCSGDATQLCGAGNRLSLYSKGDFIIFPVPVVKEDNLPGDWEYKGCVFDNGNPYVLEWLYEDTATYASSNMTINTCLERCQRFGYSAGGVEYGRQCVCGDLGAVEARGDVFKADSFCSMPCPGDRNYTCGAGNHINYYEWTGDSINTFHYASGSAAGEYDFFSTSPIVALISSVGINDKVVFVEKHGTSLDDTEGSFEFDYSTNTYRELALKTDVFCSASFTLPDKAGRMINIGGWSAESVYGVRFFTPDSPQGVDNGTNVWEEDYTLLRLFDPRWYPTAIVLSNGSLLAMGGESGSDAPIVPTCEVLPHPAGVTESTYLDYLARADTINRRNSYPFLAILPTGDIFFSQFNESRIISQTDFQTIRKLPDMPGAVNNPLTGRNYPLQGTMMIMPQVAPYSDPLTVLVCGGTTAEPGNEALDNCVIMNPQVPGAEWTIERMPSKRVMPTMVALPDGRFLMINGAKVGRGGFGLADNSNLNAVMYDPEQPLGHRMTVLANTTIARMYHSEGILLSDGKVLISGSDPQDLGKHPQEHRLEYFWPDYLLSGAAQPEFSVADKDWEYGESYSFTLESTLAAGAANLRVSLMASIGSTHGVTMGQRTLFPEFSCNGNSCTVTAPPNSFVSPPSWYQMFVLDGPTPSHATWVRIGGDPASLGNWPQLPGFTTPGV